MQVYSLEKWPIQPERIPVAICSMKWLEELPPLPPPTPMECQQSIAGYLFQ